MGTLLSTSCHATHYKDNLDHFSWFDPIISPISTGTDYIPGKLPSNKVCKDYPHSLSTPSPSSCRTVYQEKCDTYPDIECRPDYQDICVPMSQTKCDARPEEQCIDVEQQKCQQRPQEVCGDIDIV